MSGLDQQVRDISQYFAKPRFKGLIRLYSARQVAEQRGRIAPDYAVARTCAEAFYDRLRELFAARKSITTFGPYSPGQAVNIKRMGIEGIYLGGWATSAKGSITEDPGADLASYPLNQVPDEASAIVRALLTADKNQQFARARMSEEQRAATPEIDYRPFIIADADTGHGGDAHVRNLIRRFVEVGVTGYHIEDQKPGVKKCGHQGGKVLVAEQEQIMRLNAARFQLDIMGVPGIIVARTDAEAANLLDGCGDERDQPFVLGSTNLAVPTYRAATFAIMRRIHALGVADINGHQMVKLSNEEFAAADEWLKSTGLMAALENEVQAYKGGKGTNAEALLDKVSSRFVDVWQHAAGLKTYAQAVGDMIAFRASQGETPAMTSGQWAAFAEHASWFAAKATAASLGISIAWDAEHAKTPDGYYQVRDGLHYAIAKSLAAAPFADILWMETATANLDEAREFAEAIHAEFPDKMLAYNLSPSFNWDTTGMTDEQMKRFPEELGKLGFVFNFITYGGHQVDGLASEEFASALKQDGMLALARLQRKLRLLESPYKTPQTLVGGPRIDAALVASSGRTATTKAMGKGSTQHQHLVPIETPPSVLQDWLKRWAQHNKLAGTIRVRLRPVTSGSDLLELAVLGDKGEKVASIVFSELQDRKGQRLLLVRDQHTESALRGKRLTMLIHIFLIHRYKAVAVHYVSPTEDNRGQAEKMKNAGLFSSVSTEVGQIIVADVHAPRIADLLAPDGVALGKLIAKD